MFAPSRRSLRGKQRFYTPQTIRLKSKSRRGSRRRIAVKSKGKPSIFIPQSVCFIPVIQEKPNQYLKATCSSFSPEKTHIETVSPKTITAKIAILFFLLIIRSAFAELSYVCILSQKNLRKK